MFELGQDVVVHENGAHRGRVTKVARRYLTVTTRHGTWEFDKETRRHRGEHGGYVPHLYTVAEHELRTAWDVLTRAARDLPYSVPRGVTVEGVRRATAAVLALSGKEPSDG